MSGINNAGQVGGFGFFNTSTPSVFVGSPSGSVQIPFGAAHAAYAINSSSQVVGWFLNQQNNDQAFIATTSGGTALPLPTGWTASVGYGVNNAGQVVGGLSNSSLSQAFIGTTSGLSVVPLPVGWKSALASGVNNSSLVIGHGSNGAGIQAFVATASGSTPIPNPNGSANMFGYAINDSGQVAGYVSSGQAYIGTVSGVTLIPLPGGVAAGTTATVSWGALNNLGMVVGQLTGPSPTFAQTGWIWDPSHGAVLLNSLLPAGWNVIDALSISDTGLVLALASFNSGTPQWVELSPSPASCATSLSPSSQTATASASSGSFTVNTPGGCGWQAFSNDSWLTLTSGSSGTGTGTVGFQIAANTGSGTRVGTITAGDLVYTVTQSSSCSYLLNPTSYATSAASSSPSIIVTATSGCAWSATSNSSWITTSASGTGSGSAGFQVSANTTTSSRAGSLTIAGLDFQVVQAAASLPTAAFRDTVGSIRLATYASSTLSNSGGVFASDPAAAQDLNGNTFVTARDSSNSIWANVFNPNTSTWTGWAPAGGIVQGVPSIAVDTTGTAWIGTRDNFNSYWLLSYKPGTGFGAWTSLAGIFSTDPVVTACPDGSIYLIGKDNFNSMWSGHYIPGTGFQGFVFGGAIISGKPSATCGLDNAVYIAAEDNFNSNWMGRVSGNTWSPWFFGGAITSITPRIAALWNGSEAVVILDSNNVVYHTTYTEGTTNGWQPWTQLGGILSDVEPAGESGLYLAGKSANGNLWWYQQSGNLWTNIGNSGVAAGTLSAAPR